MKKISEFIILLSGIIAIMLTGCADPLAGKPFGSGGGERESEARLRVGEQLQVRLETGIANANQAYDLTIDGKGDITLPLVGKIRATGSTPAEVAERIEASYVPRFYVRCTATVLVSVRFFYIGGEVRAPGRLNWTEDVTLLKAINTAGGFTDYANRGRVEVSRGKEKRIYDYEEFRQHPEKDIHIQPGDSIYVPRSIF